MTLTAFCNSKELTYPFEICIQMLLNFEHGCRHRVVLEKFNGIDYRIIIWSTLSFFLQACQEGAKTFREEQCLRKQSGSVPYFGSSCMCVTLTVFHLYIMCNSRPYVYEASRKVRWPKIITCNFHLELQLGSWQRVFNYCI